MMLYVLICLSLSLAGVAGLQFTYLFYLDRIDRERKRRLHELELRCKDLSIRLRAAEKRVADQADIISELYVDAEEEEEVWADLIDDR